MKNKQLSTDDMMASIISAVYGTRLKNLASHCTFRACRRFAHLQGPKSSSPFAHSRFRGLLVRTTHRTLAVLEMLLASLTTLTPGALGSQGERNVKHVTTQIEIEIIDVPYNAGECPCRLSQIGPSSADCSEPLLVDAL